MNLGKRLYELQQLDLDLAKTTEILSQMEYQLEHDEPLANARADLERTLQGIAALQDKQKKGEWAVDDLEAKLKPIQQKLYAGSVQNPKERVSMQHQGSQLRSQLSQEEDKVLETMSQIEALQKEITQKTAQVTALGKECAEKQQRLLSERAELSTVLGATRRRRDGLVHTIDTAYVELYENVRGRKQGLAVARIEQGRCQGCRLNLAVNELQRARAGDLIQCSSCGRILCLG